MNAPPGHEPVERSAGVVATDALPDPGRVAVLFGSLSLLGLAIGVGLQLGGEPGRLVQQGLAMAPLFGLAALLQLGRAWRWISYVAWGWFWLLLLAGGGLTLLLIGAAARFPANDPSPEQAFKLISSGGLILLTLAIALGLTLSGGWYAVGRACGAVLQRGDPAHAQGIVGLLVITVVALIPLVALEGKAPLLLLIEQDEASWGGGDRSASGQIFDLYYSLAWIIPLAILAAGMPIQRSLRAALVRLGVLPVTWRQLLLFSGLACALVAVATALDSLIAVVWSSAGWPRTDSNLVEKLFGDVLSPAGAVGVAISAGVGEELIARGLLQPRFGWFLPNLAFAVAHAFQYGSDGVLSVFVTGAALAAIRHHWNTTAAAFTHGAYDFILVMASVLKLPGF